MRPQLVKIYLVRYQEDGQTHWMRQSYCFQLGSAICKELAIAGKRPVLVRIDAPPQLIERIAVTCRAYPLDPL